MKRLKERIEDYNKALNRLKEAFLQEPTEIVIDGTLQRYEFTFELAWKTLKDYLEYNGIIDNVGTPRVIIQSAYNSKIIKDGDKWIQMMLDRNMLSHLYDEDKSGREGGALLLHEVPGGAGECEAGGCAGDLAWRGVQPLPGKDAALP